MEPTIRVLSLGAGVQSTTLALMACEGQLAKPDGAIFADTGWEPGAVYEHLVRLAGELERANIPLHRVSKGNLRKDSINPEHRYASVPYFVRNPDGSEGMGRRQCTSEYKLAPINRKVRELLGASAPDFRRVPKGQVAEQWIGFSTDEIHRVSDKNGVSYLRPRYPLLELGMSRKDCYRFLAARGWGSTVKSACVGCPFHGNAQWRDLRDRCRRCGHHRSEHWRGIPGMFAATDPDVVLDADHLSCAHDLNPGAPEEAPFDGCSCPRFDDSEWADAIEFDRAIRKGGSRGLPLNGEAFLHRSRIPLEIAPIDRVTRNEWHDRQGDLLDLIAEEGDPDGCSPYGCRSGEGVA